MKKVLLSALGLCLVAGLALASGYSTNGLTLAALPLTGNELFAADTQLANGLNPQSEAISISQVSNYTNGGTVVMATASAGAATAVGRKVTITSEALTTAAGADYTLILADTSVTATSVVVCSTNNGTNTTAGMAVGRVSPTANQIVALIRNTHASAAWNGTIKVSCMVF